MIENSRCRVEDAEDIVAILNPIIAARVSTRLDTPFTVEQQCEFIRTFPARGIFLVAVDTTLHRARRASGRLAVRRLYACLRPRRRHRHVRRSESPPPGDRAPPVRSDFRRGAHGRATRNSSPTCEPTMKPRCRPTCTMASASSGRPNGTRRSTGDISTKS